MDCCALGGVTLNVLPVLMTVINLFSGALYTWEAPVKTKLQLIGMALVFLVLLYDSPAGLTFYWTLNNIFSLGKNIIHSLLSQKRTKNRTIRRELKFFSGEACPAMFLLSAGILVILTGMAIPSSVLASAPRDFVVYSSEPNPFWYVVNATLLALGTFVLWGGVFYGLGSQRVKKGMEAGLWALSGIFLINYFFFRNDMGILTSSLAFYRLPEFGAVQKVINLGISLGLAMVLAMLWIYKENFAKGIAWTLVLVMSCMSVRNLWIVQTEVARAEEMQKRNHEGSLEIPLSREGKNVVVIMLDRAVSSYLPIMIYERPEMNDSFSGFVYYPNTLSYGTRTNFAAPALFGGYEYSPQEINDRDTELLRDKHNEALLLLPTLFSRAGYRVTVFDMPYPGDYSATGDYAIYDNLPGVNARALAGDVGAMEKYERAENSRLRNFFCYSLAMCVPQAFCGLLYNLGNYNRANGSASLFFLRGETPEYNDLNISESFIVEYLALDSMTGMTRILDDETNTLLVMQNEATHEYTLLPEPEYEPIRKPDNAEYDADHADRFLAGPMRLRVENTEQMQAYEVNMASLLKIGEWLDHLKQMGVYDNTRIVLVSDHGWQLEQIGKGILQTDPMNAEKTSREYGNDIMEYNPLLMVKDFNAEGEVKTDTTFMMNADVPTLAVAGLIPNPINPFTGNPVNSAKKDEIQYVIASHARFVGDEGKNTFDPSAWMKVTPGGETLFDPSRWDYLPLNE